MPEPLHFSRDSFRRIEIELRPLVTQHRDELKLDGLGIPFQPQWAFYGEADAAGRLWTFGGRRPETGELVGYALYWVFRSPTFDVLQASNEAIYLASEARRGSAGARFLHFCEAQLQQHGHVGIVQHTEWLHRPYRSLLVRQGYRPLQQTYWKILK